MNLQEHIRRVLREDKKSKFIMDTVDKHGVHKTAKMMGVTITHLYKMSDLEIDEFVAKELLAENIENGKIKAYPIMMFSIGDFDKKDLPEIVDVLKRVHQATEFRPLLGFWLEDYVDEETGDVVTLGRGEVEFVKCSDRSYQVLRSSLVENDINKVITHHFL